MQPPVDLVPGEWTGHRGSRQRSDGEGCRDGNAIPVLAEIDVNFAASRRDGPSDRRNIRDRLRSQERQQAGKIFRLLVGVPRAQREKDMEARGSRGLDEAFQSKLRQYLVQRTRYLDDVSKGSALGVEIENQPVRTFKRVDPELQR